MQISTATTDPNVRSPFVPAAIGERLFAFIIDAIILTVYVTVMGSALLSLEVDSLAVWFVLVGIPLFFYTMIFEIMMEGQTPGKRAMSIRVVSIEGGDVSSGQLFIRWLFLILGFYFFSGLVAFIVVLANGRGQRIGDIVAGTRVVKFDAHTVAHQAYVPAFPVVKLLEDRDIQLIKRALQANREFENVTPIQLVSEKIKWMLGIQTTMPDHDFLTVVIKDYNYIKTS